MNITAWILQGLLAFVFLMAGFMKAFSPKEKLAAQMGWVNDYSSGTVKFIGLSEILGSIGLILPYALGIVPVLTVIAALALALVMVLAIPVHIKRKEANMVATNTVLLILLIVVVVLRF